MNISTRCNFDYNHGGFKTRGHALVAVAMLTRMHQKVQFEDSGDLYRIWLPEREAYFWPNDEMDGQWLGTFPPPTYFGKVLHATV